MRNKKYNKEILAAAVKDSNSIRAVALRLGYSGTGSASNTIKKYIDLWKIDTSHFISSSELIKTLNFYKPKPSIQDYLSNNVYISSSKLKAKLYKEGLKNPICELCGQTDVWNGKPIVLILDHINGINTDNSLTNLQIVCPNCNSQLDTFGTRNKSEKKPIIICACGIIIQSQNEKYCSTNCRNIFGNLSRPRKVSRPSYQQLLDDMKTLSFTAIGKKYGVSDNAIRKWIKLYQKPKG